MITVDRTARLLARSEMRTGEAVNRLEAADVVDLFTGLERALASPTRDTATAPPIRRAARRVQPAGDEA